MSSNVIEHVTYKVTHRNFSGPRCMYPTDSGDPELFSNVDEKTFAHSARKTTAKDEGGSNKKGKKGGGRKGEEAEAAPRSCKANMMIYISKAAAFITDPLCWTFSVRVRVRKAPMYSVHARIRSYFKY